MEQKIGSLLAVSAALLTVFAALPGKSVPRHSELISQGGLAPLCAAEISLETRDATSALRSFQTVLARTRREGVADAFERVRRRMASAGLDLNGASPDAGWPLIARSCLMAPDFSAASLAAENWGLQTGRFGPRFEYPLLSEGDGKSVWLTTADRAPLWLLRQMSPVGDLKSRAGALYGVRTDEIPRGGRFFLVTPLRLRLQPQYQFTLAVRPIGKDHVPREVYLSAHGKVLWEKPLAAASGGGWRKAEFTPQRDWVLDRILVLADVPSLPCAVTLVREYGALPDAP